MLLTWHNLAFYQALMAGLRDAVKQDRVQSYATSFLGNYRSREEA